MSSGKKSQAGGLSLPTSTSTPSSSQPAAPANDVTPRTEHRSYPLGALPKNYALELDIGSLPSGQTTPQPGQVVRPPLSAAASSASAQPVDLGSRLGRSGTLTRGKPFDLSSSSSSAAQSEDGHQSSDDTEGFEGDTERDEMSPPAQPPRRGDNASETSTLRHFPHTVDTSAAPSGHGSRAASAARHEFPPGESSDSLHHDFRANLMHSRYSSTDSLPHFGRSNSNHDANHMRSHFASTKPFPTPGLKSTDPFADKDYKSVEEKRLEEDQEKKKHWKRWGPYVAERQWATVREDYSGNGDAWTHFPHEHARSRAYRWGEDGLGGLSDNHQRLCFSVALWNEKDPILKERMFGTTGHQGNHGEDVKEMYYYLDSTPTHSYMKYLYKYPQREYPYEQLVRESSQRSRDVTEFEITDTDAFDEDKYWDVFIEYAKDEDNSDGMSIRITAYNRGPDAATLHIVPQIFFRNTWSWAKEKPTGKAMPSMKAIDDSTIQVDHETLGRYYLHVCDSPAAVGPISRRGPVPEVEGTVVPELLFCENDTNLNRLYGVENKSEYVKDAFHDHIIPAHRPPMPKTNGANGKHASDSEEGSDSEKESTPGSTPRMRSEQVAPEPQEDTRTFVNPGRTGTKGAAHFTFENVPGNGGCAVVRLKLTPQKDDAAVQDEEIFDSVLNDRRSDADEFYARFNSHALSDDLRNIMRQALGGMLWNKQFYLFVQKEWIEGDPGQPPPPPERKHVRNADWKHLHIDNVLSMPDKWEYPFFAIWDTAFHCIPLAMVDPAFAKNQLELMTREWYMKPDGAFPAYEWNFDDVNPPVHAWATFRVFKIERKMFGRADLKFLERVFQKLLINYTWWTNRKDSGGVGVFEGGFLGLDNIGLFNRSEKLPTGGVLRQADGTAWMAFYCLNMLNMALELAKHNDVYEDIASKFFEHFLFISDAMTFRSGENAESLWNSEDGFYYDAIDWGHGNTRQLPIRSLVGLIPLYATLTLEPGTIKRFPGFKKRMDWFIKNRSEITNRNIANMSNPGKAERRLLALVNEDRLRRILARMLDEKEFLSDFGIRTMSRWHVDNPLSMDVNGENFTLEYWPGDSKSGMFGGNSNWRGPIWLAPTALIIESLQRFHQYFGPEFLIECPTGSGEMMTLAGVADEIQHRIIHMFARDQTGERATNGGSERLNRDPNFRDYLNFYEFFHADNGKGLGASHQTGWTGYVAYFIWQTGHSARLPRTPRTPRSSAMHYFDETVPPTPASHSEAGDYLSDYGGASGTEMEPDEL